MKLHMMRMRRLFFVFWLEVEVSESMGIVVGDVVGEKVDQLVRSRID